MKLNRQLFRSHVQLEAQGLVHTSCTGSCTGRARVGQGSGLGLGLLLVIRITWAAVLLKYRPSPPRAMVLPFTSSPRELNSDWILHSKEAAAVESTFASVKLPPQPRAKFQIITTDTKIHCAQCI